MRRTRRRSAPQYVPVTLSWRPAAGVLALMATTLRRGHGYEDRWSMSPSVALTSVTVVEAFPAPMRYVSRASASASALAPNTTYTFSYSVVMRTSEHTWVGSSSVTVTVGADGSMASLDGGARGAIEPAVVASGIEPAP